MLEIDNSLYKFDDFKFQPVQEISVEEQMGERTFGRAVKQDVNPTKCRNGICHRSLAKTYATGVAKLSVVFLDCMKQSLTCRPASLS